MSLLAVEGLSKYFGGVRALHSVDAVLDRGEVLAIVGDNGAGKSTFAKIVAGVFRPDEGQVYWNGVPVKIDSPEHARQLGIETVYQDLALVPDFNAAENLFFGRELSQFGILRHAKMHDKTKSILEDLRIKLASTRVPIRYLSGGQRQSVAIGRAVAWGKELVILDEPTAALGVQESQRVLDLIRHLRQQGSAIIVISHNMTHVLEVADRVMVLRMGEKVADLPAEGLDVEAVVRHIVSGRPADPD